MYSERMSNPECIGTTTMLVEYATENLKGETKIFFAYDTTFFDMSKWEEFMLQSDDSELKEFFDILLKDIQQKFVGSDASRVNSPIGLACFYNFLNQQLCRVATRAGDSFERDQFYGIDMTGFEKHLWLLIGQPLTEVNRIIETFIAFKNTQPQTNDNQTQY